MDYTDLISLLGSLPTLNLELDNPNLIADMTWFSVSESADNLKVVYVFRSKSDELLIAKNGKVTDGSWDFIPNTNSVFIRLGQEKKLYNALLLKGHYLILKQDGTKEFILMVNQAYYQRMLEVAPTKIWDLMVKDLRVLLPAPKPQAPEPELETQLPEPEPVAPIREEVAQSEIIENIEEEVAQETWVEETQTVSAEVIEEVLPPMAEEKIEEPEAVFIPKKQEVAQSEEKKEGEKKLSLLDKLRAADQAEQEDEDDDVFPLGQPKKPSLNDMLKEKLHKEEQGTLLDRLSEKSKKKH